MRTYQVNSKEQDIPTTINEWDNNLELLQWINQKRKSRRNQFIEEIQRNPGDNWYSEDCKDYDEALVNLEFGNKNYTKEFIEGLKEIEYNGEDDRVTFMDIEGFAYDMGAVVNGEPECCINMSPPETGKHLTVYVGCDFSCHSSSRDIKNRGIAIANFLCTLLTKNYSLTLKFLLSANYEDHPLCHIINTSNKTLNVNEIAFYTTPEFMRMIGISLDSLFLDNDAYHGNCRGKTDFAVREKIIKENGFFIPAAYDTSDLTKKWETVKEANDWVTDLFNQYVMKGYSTVLIKGQKN